MKKKFKKNRLKIFIALSLMITCVFGVMFAANTFAYEDEFNNTYYDFNQLVENGNFENNTIWNATNGITEISNNTLTYTQNYSSGNNKIIGNILGTKLNHKYLVITKINYLDNLPNNNIFVGSGGYSGYQFSASTIQNLNTWYNLISIFSRDNTQGDDKFNIYPRLPNVNDRVLIQNCELIDLTQMFGIGNEPTTINETNIFFNLLGINLNEYQRYTTSKKLFISNNSNTEYQQLTNDYDELDENYNELNDNYNELDENYNELNDNYTELEEIYNQLETDYNTLESDYNTLQNQVNSIEQISNNGLWSLCGHLYYINTNDSTQGMTYDSTTSMITNGYLNGVELNITNCYNYLDVTNYTCVVMLGYGVTYQKNVPINLCNFNIDTNMNFDIFRIQFGNINNPNDFISISFTNEQLRNINYIITYDYIINNFNYNFEYYNNLQYIWMSWTKNSADDKILLYSNNDNYTIGYQDGYYQGAQSVQPRIEFLNNRITNLNNEINSLQITINSLNEQISSFNSDYNLNNLMWTIGSTPFESFKHIWNVNFLGVNVSEFILGLITTFIGLYILKKFFF